MPRRIDVELTSDRGDGSWSWRAAGARQPKGVVEASLLYDGVRVGDVVRAEADFDIDGITITSVQAPKGARREPDRIEVLGTERDFTPVTSSLTGRARERAERGEDDRPRRGRDDRGGRAGGRSGGPGRDAGTGRGPRPGREGQRGPRDGAERGRGPARERPAPPPPKPKPKKLRPARTHRDAFLTSLAPEQQPIAEQLLRGGMPAVRTALEQQNAKAKSEGGLEVPTDTVLGIAEQLVMPARVADWLDRAEAAKATGEELALRDLRSVVASADDVARDDATRALAAELRSTLERRTEADQAAWLSDVEQSLASGRVVRALRLCARPPEQGTSLPEELTTRLSEAAGAALSDDIAADRWATVLDAVAYSPVRRAVVPAGVPSEPGETLLAAVRKHAGRTPAIASLFGVEPPPDSARGAKRPSRSAGRNANLSRSGGTRNNTVPVPGRPGAPPVPPAKRIPPPPGRQIGATLPGSPPPSRPDPAAPLAPPSASGTTESGRDGDAAEAPTLAALEAGLSGEGTPDETAASAPAPSEPTEATSAPTAPEPAPTAPEAAPERAEAELHVDAAPSLQDGPVPAADQVADAPLASPAPEAAPPAGEAAAPAPEAAPPAGEAAPAPELSGPADSALPEPPATEEGAQPEAEAADGDELAAVEGDPDAVDAVVSEAAEGPFEPPADAPAPDEPGDGEQRPG